MSLRRALLLRPLLLPAALGALVAGATGCGRSAGGSGGGEKAAEALSAAQEARGKATAASEAVDTLDGRVTTLEDRVSDHSTRLGAAEASLTALDSAQAALAGRVTTLEQGGGAGVASAIAVDNPAAAGFLPGEGVTTVEQGFAALNGRVNTQTGRIDALETELSTNLPATVVQLVNDGIANGGINAEVDVTFTPPDVDIDPRADEDDDVPEYSASETLAEAVMALRFANQIKYTPVEDETRLGDLYDGTVRSYVQEAIRILDKDLYALVVGDLSVGLDTTNLPQDGSYDTVQGAVEDLYARVNSVGSDPTLLALIQQQVAENGQPYILGPTTVSTTGLVTDGTYSGLRGATGLCQAEFAGEPSAHLCSLEEAQRALSLGRYAGTLADVTTWTAAPTLADSCDGLLSADPGDDGTTLVVDLDYVGAGGTGHVIHTGSASCDVTYPVLCCR